jgi:thioredoxin reductase (NADPH)
MITLDVLRTVPILADLDEAALHEVASAAADVHLAADEWLAHEGQPPSFFLILSGSLESSKIVAGAEKVITHYRAGEYVGLVPLLLQSVFVVSLRAIEQSRVLRLEPMAFQALIHRSEKLAAEILRTMTERVSLLQRVSIESPAVKTLVVGHSADPACYELRQFLSGNQMEFRWVDPAVPEGAAQIPAGAASGPFPAIILKDGPYCGVPLDASLPIGWDFKRTRASRDMTSSLSAAAQRAWRQRFTEPQKDCGRC